MHLHVIYSRFKTNSSPSRIYAFIMNSPNIVYRTTLDTHTHFSVFFSYENEINFIIIFKVFTSIFAGVLQIICFMSLPGIFILLCGVRAAICEHTMHAYVYLCERQGISHNFHRSDEIICVRNANTILPIPYMLYIQLNFAQRAFLCCVLFL